MEVDYFEEECLALLPTANSGDSDGLLDDATLPNQTDSTPLLVRSLLDNCEEETMQIAWGA